MPYVFDVALVRVLCFRIEEKERNEMVVMID